MTFEAKTLAPLPCDPDTAHGAFEDAAAGSITLLEAPPGYVLTEGLALAFMRLDRHPLWLRLGPEDRDPATFLLSLVTAAQRFRPGAGQATLTLMKERPGPVFGWPPLFAQLARDLRSCMIHQGSLVLEDIHLASAMSPTLSMISRHLLPELAGVAPCVLLSNQGPQAAPLDKFLRKTASELRLSAPDVKRLLLQWAPALTARSCDRATILIGGRAGIMAGLRELASTTDHGLEPLLERVANREELVKQTAATLLAHVGREPRGVLGLAARVEYAHPAMISAIVGEGQLPPGPWLQRLENGWVRVRPCWRQSLLASLDQRAMPGRDTLHQSADWLAQADACEQAVRLYLDIGDQDCAARVITSRASALMDLGQWETVGRWLAQLPERLLYTNPEVSSYRADIAAARGDTATAQRWFDVAAAQYGRRNDVEGACRSMLSGSAVAAEAGQLTDALSRAYAASSLANTADRPATQMWASWQLGRVALAAGDSDSALASFRRAASSVSPVSPVSSISSVSGSGDAAAHPVLAASDLALRISELRRQQEWHREARTALNRAEHEALNQLMAATRWPAADDVFVSDGWSGAPAPLKIPVLLRVSGPTPAARAGPLIRLRRALRVHRDSPYSAPSAAQAGGSVISDPPPAPDRSGASDGGDAAAPGFSAAPGLSGLSGLSGPELAVHLLGPLYVAVDDVAVEDWTSARCRSLFGYLLTHRAPWPAREVLMEAFWPGSSPEASRNSLNVAIHGLRRTLRTITDTPVVVYGYGAYRINRDVRLWLDVDEFDSRVESGRRSEDAGEIDQAARDYEFAGSLYRGDFMADDPYEDWAALARERLRLAYLDVLGRLSNLYFNAGQYTACASLSQRIIETDPCREDAHRRLMRCYSRQGQPHLALMQYRACARALADELTQGMTKMSPGPMT